MSPRRDDVTVEEWLTQIRQQPEAVARLLNYETRIGHLILDERGHVWNGGIGPGYGSAFKMQPEQPADMQLVDQLAQDIRTIDGAHELGAGALAEHLVARGWARIAELEATIADLRRGGSVPPPITASGS